MVFNFIKKWLQKREDKKNPIINPKDLYCPKGFVVHHKDGNKQNNRFNNLEVIKRADLLKRNLERNLKNRKKNHK